MVIAYQYMIVHVPKNDARRSYDVRPAYYSYGVYDRDGREILIYQWHPEGVSHVTSPHLHVSFAPALALPYPRSDQQRTIDFGKLHLPTGHVLLEDVIELLIREFDIEPQRDDWQEVLQANREALRRDRIR